MVRPLRIEFPGGLYHVTTRGDRREAIYLSDADRQYWLDLLGNVCTRHNWLCHAYCLMDNHFHIVVETIDGHLSAGMRQLNGVYTQWHNPHPQHSRSPLSRAVQSHHRAARGVLAGIGSLRGAQPRSGGHLRLARRLALEQLPSHARPRYAAGLVASAVAAVTVWQ